MPAPPIPSVVVHASATSGPTTLVVGRSLTDNLNLQPSYHHGGGAAGAGNPPMQMPPMPFSTPDPTLRSVPAPAAPTIVPPAAVMSSPPLHPHNHSPTEAFIPIMHRRAPSPPPPVVIPTTTSNNNAHNPKIAIPPIPASPDSDDDGFTPVTPASAGGIGIAPRDNSSNSLRSPRSAGGLRAFDALGIPVVVAAINRGILGRVRSRKVTIVDPSKEDYRDDGDDVDNDEFEDVSPLTPVRDRDVEQGGGDNGNGKDRKTMRRTLAGIIEGWWDLGLLERGKSLRRKG